MFSPTQYRSFYLSRSWVTNCLYPEAGISVATLVALHSLDVMNGAGCLGMHWNTSCMEHCTVRNGNTSYFSGCGEYWNLIDNGANGGINVSNAEICQAVAHAVTYCIVVFF